MEYTTIRHNEKPAVKAEMDEGAETALPGPRGSCNNCPQDSSGRFSWKTRQQVFLLRLQRHLPHVPPHL